jgi:hypothetical protein
MFDTVGFIIRLESGEVEADELADGVQHLIDNGLVWQLQGSYGRLAVSLIQAGQCVDTHGVLAAAA